VCITLGKNIPPQYIMGAGVRLRCICIHDNGPYAQSQELLKNPGTPQKFRKLLKNLGSSSKIQEGPIRTH